MTCLNITQFALASANYVYGYCMSHELEGQVDLGVFVFKCVLQRRRHAIVSRTGLSVCPCNVFNGASTHSASLVRMMLITAYSTLPHCPAAPPPAPISTHTYTCVDTHTFTYKAMHTKHKEDCKSKQATCKCDHKQIRSESTGNGRAFINTHVG